MLPRVFRHGLLAACLAAANGAPAFCQVAAGEITGVVRDQGGAPVPGAAVSVTAAATNRPFTTTTALDGAFTAPSLAPGEYSVRVELPGFKPLARRGIQLATGEKTRLELVLVVGDVREQVT